MEPTVLAHGGTAGAAVEIGLILVPLAIMGVLSLLRKRKTQGPNSKRS